MGLAMLLKKASLVGAFFMAAIWQLPALALYRKRGFVNGAAFGDYVLTDFNQCLHLALD